MQLGDGPVFERLPERQPQDLKGEAVAHPSALQCHSFPPVGVIGDLNPERNHAHQWVDLDCFHARAWPGTRWHQEFPSSSNSTLRRSLLHLSRYLEPNS